MLWNRSLVMYDKETGSLWSHILGECMQGELKGTQLEQVVSVMTDWKTWRRDYPGTTVVWISFTSKDYRRNFYQWPERFVLGIADAGKAKAWSFDALMKAPATNDEWQANAVLVTFDEPSMTARLFSRKLNDRVLTFRFVDGRLIDAGTKTTWNPVTGVAINGRLAGEQLKPLPAIVSYKRTWKTFHPKSE